MPIFEFKCVACKNVVEKVTLAKVKIETVPQTIIETCKGKCAGAKTRHQKIVSAPAYVGITPPATSKRATRMSEMRKAKDPAWKQRVKQGLNPEGKRLTNLKKNNRQDWENTVNTAYPDLREKQKEVVGRAKAGEFKTMYDAVAHKG
jgi:hypothetical protein